MSILEPSKHLMYEWYYHHLKAQHGGRAELLYMDTDSLVRKIQTEDVYADMAYNADQYDTGNYPKNPPLYSTANKKVLGKMKYECAGTPIAELVSLRPKMLNFDSRWRGGAQSKGSKEMCREKARPSQPVQRCSVAREAVPPRYGHAAKPGALYLPATCE